MTQMIEIRVPDIGDFSDIPVIEVLVLAGDSVDAEQSLVTLESDKATMEVPTPVTGLVREMRVVLGDTVSEGDVVAVIEAEEVSETTQTDAKSESQSETVQAVETDASTPKQAVGSQPAPIVARPAAPTAGSRQSPPVPMGTIETRKSSLGIVRSPTRCRVSRRSDSRRPVPKSGPPGEKASGLSWPRKSSTPVPPPPSVIRMHSSSDSLAPSLVETVAR